MPKVINDLPKDLINLRALEGLLGSRKNLAKGLGISTASINYWFTNRSYIPSKYISKLAELGDGRFESSDFVRDV